MSFDLDNTDNCPLGHRCESCGTAGEKLTVTIGRTPLGVLCFTACPICAKTTKGPAVAVATAVRLVTQHCMHLGITADDMADELDDQAGGQ